MYNSLFADQTTHSIGDIRVKIQSHFGHYEGINYFKVFILQEDSDTLNKDNEKLALLRMGNIDSGLSKELKVRELISNTKFISPLITFEIQKLENIAKGIDFENENFVKILEINDDDNLDNSNSIFDETRNIKENSIKDNINENINEVIEDLEEVKDNTVIDEEDYLEEEVYPDKIQGILSNVEVLLVLSELPDVEKTLEFALSKPQSLESALLIASQVCQFLRLLNQQGWCIYSLFYELIKLDSPPQFFDLTSIHPIKKPLDYGLMGIWYPPELLFGEPLSESTSSYTIGVLLLRLLFPTIAIDQANQDQAQIANLEVNAPPKIQQIIKICLSQDPGERFSLNSLLELLIETRRQLKRPQAHWQTAQSSTVGLSLSRLNNEDSYGIKQYISSQHKTIILAAIADGMGGLSQGEVASQLAINTLLNSPIANDLDNHQKQNLWLTSLIEAANLAVTENVKHGGTTLSVVLGIGDELSVAHVGDSRILLIRKGILCQLTEDHSMVAMLLNSGQISYEESLKHPDRNILTKSLGSKSSLSPQYVQNLTHFSPNFKLQLENEDIVLLCSDGVWDLIDNNLFVDIFTSEINLQLAVNKIIENVLKLGANDNATLLALKVTLSPANL